MSEIHILRKRTLPAIVCWALLTATAACTHEQGSVSAEARGIRREAKTKALRFTSGIRAIFHDSRGRHWFGSIKEGVAMYDGTCFSYLTTDDGLADNQITAIQEDRNGIIWFTTQNGVSSFDGERIVPQTGSVVPISGLYGKAYYAAIEATEWTGTEDELWFAAGNREGVYRHDGNQLHFHAFPHLESTAPFNGYMVTGIAPGREHRTWFATYAAIFGYDGRALEVVNGDALVGTGLDSLLHIRSVFEDSQGRVWIGNNGVGLLLKEGDRIAHFSEAMGLIHSGSGLRGDASPQGTLEHVFTIAEDRSGTLWFGDRDTGLWSYDGERMTNYGADDGLTNASATAIYLDRDGVLWLGMNDGRVYTYDGVHFQPQFAVS